MSKPVGTPVQSEEEVAALSRTVVVLTKKLGQLETSVVVLIVFGGLLLLNSLGGGGNTKQQAAKKASVQSVAWVVTAISPDAPGKWHAMKYRGHTYYRRVIAGANAQPQCDWFDSNQNQLPWSSLLKVSHCMLEREFAAHNKEQERLKRKAAVDALSD